MASISVSHPSTRPSPISAAALIAGLRAAAVSHVVVVPDTVQKLFLAALADASDLTTIFTCTEDEAVGVNAGLYATGRRPILSIQNNGLFACLNTIRGIALDAATPTVMLIGQYGGRADVAPEDNPLRMVRLLEPTLAAWDVPVAWLWRNEDVERLPRVYEDAQKTRGPAALLIPVPVEA